MSSSSAEDSSTPSCLRHFRLAMRIANWAVDFRRDREKQDANYVNDSRNWASIAARGMAISMAAW